jgi:ABC-type glutathione transport system ATPase component
MKPLVMPLELKESALAPPAALRRRVDWLSQEAKRLENERRRTEVKLQSLKDYLSIAGSVDEALEKLSEELFGQIIRVLEEKLTLALQEVLEQPISLKVDRSFKRKSTTLSFHVERGGEREDILKGQGGSVLNILSVGLRMFALATLDPAKHRRFLVLDEQDCWLRPDLVPRLVKIVHDAGKALGFQVLMISHHDVEAFRGYADKIYKLVPDPAGVRAVEWSEAPGTADDRPVGRW